MKRPPRKPDERLFSRKTVAMAMIQGISILAVCIAIFMFTLTTHSPEVARAMMFITLVASSIMIILVNRSWTKSAFKMLLVPNTALKWVVLGATVVLSSVMLIPFARELFHFAPLQWYQVLICVAAAIGCFLWFELVRFVGRKKLSVS